MRTENSIKNITISILTQIIIVLLGFISRKIFLNSFGAEYLGVNGLLTNVISMLSLVEGGVGTSIIYNLYKPLADEDEKTIISLVQLYKKIYLVLAIIILILSCILYPFLNVLIGKDSNVEFIGVVYFIFVIKNIISYLNAHKWSLINADQRGYILAKYNLIFNIITTVVKSLTILITNNYIIYLVVELFIFTLQNMWNGRIVNKYYPYIKTKVKYKIDKNIMSNIVKNVKAIFLHKIGGYCVFSTDNIIISAFVNIKTVGLYSNYTMIISQLSALLNPILNGVAPSVGNLLATEDKEKSFTIFKTIYLLNFWIYSFCIIFLFNLLEPFINWWLGDGLLLKKSTFIVILINFYISGLRSSINIFKEKAGIFSQDKYAPLIEASINLISSIILVRRVGLIGVFLGTTISSILVPVWIQSKLVYNKIFNKSVFEYFRDYLIYIVYLFIAIIPTSFVCSFIRGEYIFLQLILRGIICVIIPNLIIALLVRKTEEFSYLMKIIDGFLKKFKIRFGKIENAS